MSERPISQRQAAVSLLRALEQGSDMRCEEARALLPLLVQAEQAGAEVDADPAFAALLQHLDTCADCLDLYEALAEDLAVLTESTAPLPAVPAPPPVFVPVRRTLNGVVRVLEGFTRRLELTLTVPRVALASASGDSEQTVLFAEQVPELTGAPDIVVTLEWQGDTATVRVAVTGQQVAQWQVQLTLTDQTVVALTDANGRAEIAGLATNALRNTDSFDLLVSEVIDEA